jgi:26S proteasome regulatory subunit N5
VQHCYDLYKTLCTDTIAYDCALSSFCRTLLHYVFQEEEGDISSAADILQEVHVETYGSLSKKEKVEYILEQLRLTISKQDFVRAAIVAGKINRKHLNEMATYKIQFFTLLSIIHRHEKNELELVKDYHAIYLTHVDVMKSNPNDDVTAEHVSEADAMELENPTTTTPATSWKDALKAVVVFVLLAPYSNEQHDILNHIAIDVNLEKLPSFQYVTTHLLLYCVYKARSTYSSILANETPIIIRFVPLYCYSCL